jgi:hypothetical protein
MASDNRFMKSLLDLIVELLDIPPSHYKKAADRYHSLGDWLNRDESRVLSFYPQIYPQGSFRYGTVIRPLLKADEYDLDLVCQIELSKASVSQMHVKQLVGDEVKAYAKAHSFKEPSEEKPRCWRLNYADDVSFHMDILPCVPEQKAFIDILMRSDVPLRFAATAIAITDKRHPKYKVIDPNWLSSNPRGIAAWFEDRMRPIAQPRIKRLVENRAYASVDDVPAYEWKTPLQRSIQILKRHRDVMFKDSPEWKPLSMIITTLAAHAYNGETDLYDALTNIVADMPTYVRSSRPRIPNPVHPAEDFADRWAKDARYEQNFWAWHEQVKADMDNLRRLTGKVADITRAVRRTFALDLPADMEKRLEAENADSGPHILTPAPVVHIASAPKPWREDG